MAPAFGDAWGRVGKPSGLVGVCAMCLVLFVISQLPLRLSFSSDRQAQIHSSVDSSLFQGFISNRCGRPFVNGVKCRSGGDQGTAIVFLAAYTKFPPGTPLGDLFYLKSVLVARISNPTAPIIFLLPKEVITRHPEMITLLGTYRINIRWIDDLEQGPMFKTFDRKHKAYCARLNITTCFWDLMYTRFGMAAQILRAEGYQRALFLDNDVGLYEDISFFTRFPEGWVSAFDWTTQVALWDVETMESFFNWLMHYFDTEPAPVTEDPGDMMGARLFLRRHPRRSRRILCGPGESLLCGNGPVFQAMESIQHVNCDLVNQTSCPLHNCGNQFEKMIIWKQDNHDRYIPFLNGTIQLPIIHFGDACEPAINSKMYPVTLTGLEPATNATY